MNRYSKEDRTSYALGMSLTIEALKHKSEYVEKVILSDKALKNEQFSYLLSLCEKNRIETVYDDRLIEKLSVKENCYCIGVFRKFYTESSIQKRSEKITSYYMVSMISVSSVQSSDRQFPLISKT